MTTFSAAPPPVPTRTIRTASLKRGVEMRTRAHQAFAERSALNIRYHTSHTEYREHPHHPPPDLSTARRSKARTSESPEPGKGAQPSPRKGSRPPTTSAFSLRRPSTGHNSPSRRPCDRWRRAMNLEYCPILVHRPRCNQGVGLPPTGSHICPYLPGVGAWTLCPILAPSSDCERLARVCGADVECGH